MTPQDLEELFAEARQAIPATAPPDLMARVLADGYAVQDSRRAAPVPVAPRAARPGPGLIARIVGALGGMSAVAGLASAAVVGIGIGLVQPSPVTAMSSLIWATQEMPLDTIELFPDLAALLDEEGMSDAP